MFKQLIEKLIDTSSAESDEPHDMRRISVQLLLEVARSDANVDEVERDIIIKAILEKTEYSATEISLLMSESEEAVDSSISFHQHIRLVNERFNYAQKTQLVEQMWQVAYADGVLDAYEEAFIRQIADLVYLKHRDFVQAKLRVSDSIQTLEKPSRCDGNSG